MSADIDTETPARRARYSADALFPTSAAAALQQPYTHDPRRPDTRTDYSKTHDQPYER